MEEEKSYYRKELDKLEGTHLTCKISDGFAKTNNLGLNEESAHGIVVWLLEKFPPKKVYYLFGQEAIKYYTEERFSTFLKNFSSSGGSVEAFSSLCNPADVLDAYDGYHEFIEITEEEYNEISKL